MTATAQKTAEWYTQMLMPLENTIKLTIINRLSASLLENEENKKTEMSFFDGLNNSWNDGISPEAEAAAIRSARTQGVTRVLEDF